MEQSSSPSTSRSRGRLYGVIFGVVVIALVIFGIAHRSAATARLRVSAADMAVPTVAVITPLPAKDAGQIILPGTLEPLNSAAIYAQTSGYIKGWSVDIGDAVKQGQELAVLDAPELEHQLAQARADYASAMTEQGLAQSTSKRVKGLAQTGAVSQQAIENATGDADAKGAAANAALANVKRLEAQQGFTHLIAPFDGTVTSRAAQIGDLVVAGVAGAKPLFTVSDTRRVRVYVRVPQNYSARITTGMKAALSVPEYPDRKFEAAVTRSSRAVDSDSGAVLVELQADNADGALLPGSYAEVVFTPPPSGKGITVPGSAILYRGDTPAVAVLDADNHVTLHPISIGRDEGKFVEVTAGLNADDRLVDTPPDAIRDGDVVTPKVDAKEDTKEAPKDDKKP